MSLKGVAAARRDREVVHNDAEAWDAAVSHLLGPEVVGVKPEDRQRCALELAAAALRAAGEYVIAENLLN